MRKRFDPRIVFGHLLLYPPVAAGALFKTALVWIVTRGCFKVDVDKLLERVVCRSSPQFAACDGFNQREDDSAGVRLITQGFRELTKCPNLNRISCIVTKPIS